MISENITLDIRKICLNLWYQNIFFRNSNFWWFFDSNFDIRKWITFSEFKNSNFCYQNITFCDIRIPENIKTCQAPEKHELLRIKVNKRSRSSVCSETEVGLRIIIERNICKFCCFVLYWSKRHTMALKRLSKVDVVSSVIMKCNSKVYYD